MNDIKSLQCVGIYNDPDYGTLPLYETYGFINTAEGWNLLAKLKNPLHPDYVAAKAIYEAKEGVVA